ncbi:MAG: hypothetical protein ACRDPY_18180 [Streptosporangiaceae bacterium]
MTTTATTRRVGIIDYGAIGRVVDAALTHGQVRARGSQLLRQATTEPREH